MATTKDVNVGSLIRYNGEVCYIMEWQHTMPGKGGAFYQAKMKNIKTGKSVIHRFRSGENVDVARVMHRELQYIYPEGEHIICMDLESFEQIHIPAELFGESAKFLKEEMIVKVGFEGDDALLAEPPTFVELEITYTEPGIKGDTATNSMKPATLETGAEIQVPLFVNQGDKIKIDTRTGEYSERVK